MRRSNWTPSIVPGSDWDVYLVVDNLDPLGTVYRETDAQIADLDTVIADLESGQYNDPMCVVAFNTGEGWSKDVSQDIAQSCSGAPLRDWKTCRHPCSPSSTGTLHRPGS